MSVNDNDLPKEQSAISGSLDSKKRNSSSKRNSSRGVQPSLPTTTNLEEMKNEQLYLLEVLVNTIEVHKEVTQVPKDQELPPLNVRIKFLDFPCIEISQDDFLCPEKKDEAKEDDLKTPSSNVKDAGSADHSDLPTASTSLSDHSKSGKSDTSSQKVEKVPKPDRTSKGSKTDSGKVKRSASKPNVSLGTGKSCLFPLSPLELLRQIQRHPLMLHVYRKNAENETFMIGHCKVKLGQEFEDAIVKAVYDNLPFPITTTIESECKLTNTLGDPTGRISVFIRLSCFGVTIITEFQLLGEESEGYIFKTSKKDNTLEAQKKKGCFLFSKSPYKKENVVKSLNMHDISPLKPIITTEENVYPISGEISNPYLTSPFKVVPWRKYVKECGCEDPDDDISEIDEPVPFGLCGCGQKNLPPYIDQARMCDVPPCPLPDCDCYSLSPPTTRYQEKPTTSIKRFSQSKQADKRCCVEEGGTTCRDCEGSPTNLNYQNQKNKCPVDDCDCLPKLPKTSSPPHMPPANSAVKKGCPCEPSNVDYSKHCPVNDCECFNSRQRTNFIRKKCPPVSTPYNGIISPTGDCKTNQQQYGSQNSCPVEDCECSKNFHVQQRGFRSFQSNQTRSSVNSRQCPSISRQNCPNIPGCGNPAISMAQNNIYSHYTSNAGGKTNPEDTSNCFFSEMGQTSRKSNPPNNYNTVNPMKCKIGYNNRNECFCYGGGTAKPYTDTFGSQHTKWSASFGREYKTGYEAGPGPGGSNVDPKTPSQIEEPLQSVVEEERASQKTDEIGGGGDNNWQELNDLKAPTKEKSDELSKQNQTDENTKKTDEVQESCREQEQDQCQKGLYPDEKVKDDRADGDKKQQKRKRKFHSIFRYTAGMYPGIAIGHRHCTKDFRFVPKTMGWLWNTEDLGDNLRPRRGWRPGAINRTISKMIREGKLAAGLLVEEENEDKRSTKSTKRTRRPFTPRSGGVSSHQNSGEYSTVPQPPTLHLHKKDGAYFISMNPLKAESDEEDEDRPPLMFKILPHEDEASTTSESSLEIEFTAPGAFRKKPLKPVMETIDTQYSDPESVPEVLTPPAQKGKKGPASKKGTESNPPSTMASVAKDNKWDADQPTQVAKTKK